MTNIAKIEKAGFLQSINDFDELDKIVNYVASSTTYNKSFLLKEEIDPKDDTKKIRVADKDAIATCLMTGIELGLKAMETIQMAPLLLEPNAMVKIATGRDLGISYIASLRNIYVWPSGGRNITYIGIHIVYKCLNDVGAIIEVIEDGTKEVVDYTTINDNVPIEYDPQKHVCVNRGIKPDILGKELESGKIPVKASIPYFRALVKITRGNNSLAIPYNSKQAVEAGLLFGINSRGEEVKGKDNWNNHTATHLVKMSVIISARILVADKLNGMYIPEEMGLEDPSPIEDVNAEEV